MTSNANHSSTTAPSSSRATQSQTYAAQIPQYHQQAASATPAPNQQYSQQSGSSYTQPHQANSINTTYAATHLDHYSTPPNRYPQSTTVHRSTTTAAAAGYNAPRPSEVYHLPESANAAIPLDIREQFQRDDKGNILFFTTPPVDVLPAVNEGSAVGHTAKYLANKIRRKMALKEQRKAAGLPETEDAPVSKKVKITSNAPAPQTVEDLRATGLKLLINQMNQGTEEIYRDIYGLQWEEGMKYEREKLMIAQDEAGLRRVELEASERRRTEQERMSLEDRGLYLDDYDPRY